MQQLISSIMAESVTVVNIDDTVEDVECVLGAYKYSCLPVVDPDQHCFGIITSNDLTRFHMQKGNAKKVRAWEICSHQLIEVPPSLPIGDAAQLIINNNIHHLIITENNSVTGIVSSIDLLKAYVAGYSSP